VEWVHIHETTIQEKHETKWHTRLHLSTYVSHEIV
jgi:hypothetical protein